MHNNNILFYLAKCQKKLIRKEICREKDLMESELRRHL